MAFTSSQSCERCSSRVVFVQQLTSCLLALSLKTSCITLSLIWRVKAVVSIQPDAHVFIGEDVTLRCDTQGGGDTQWSYSWYKNNNRLYTDGGYPASTKELNIWYAGVSVGGSYTCRGQDSEISDAVTLTVSEKPKATVRVNPQSSVYTGDTITLSCELQQGAGWRFLWVKNNPYVNIGATDTITLNVTVDTAGETGYRCRARRRNAWANTDYYTDYSDFIRITVRVRPKPVASVNPDKQVFSGDAVTLRCDIQDESVSSWQYSWYKDPSHSRVSSEQVYTISGVKATHTGTYTCRGAERGGSRSSHFSDAVTLTVSERPRPVLSASPQSWLTEGDSVTLSCEVTGSSTDWTFSWYTTVPYRSGLTQITNSRGYNMSVELLSDSSRGSGGKYTLSPAALKHTGVYMCRGERGEPAFHTQYSNPQPLWITGESPPVSLIINPNRTQHFTSDSLSLSCNSTDQSRSTGWTVRRYTHSEGVLDCSPCKISSLSTSYTGVYWCHSESGENRNPVNITVQDGAVILESPVHPVTERHPQTLRCLYRNPKPSNLRADFYKDGSVLQTQTTGEMIILKVSKSDEGFYHCKHPERGESLKSWASVRLLVSLIPVAHVQGRVKAVVSIQPDAHVFIGERVTLRCDTQGGGDTQRPYSWNKNNNRLYTDRGYLASTKELNIWSVGDSDGGSYTCRGQDSEISDAVTLTVSGESPPVSLIINPNRTQHFTSDSLSLSCNSTDQSRSTGWTVRRYTHSEGVLDCSPCKISSLSTSYTGVYWCHSESGENRNPVNITVQDGAVILESPVHPVAEGHPLTLHCLYRNPKPSNLRGDFYKDGSVLQPQTTGEMIIHKVSKSHEGFYHCKHPERGESLKSWVSVRREKPCLKFCSLSSVPGFRSSVGTVGVAVGLGFFFIALLILMILLWSYKRKKEKQQKTNQTSDQNQRRSGAEETQAGYTPLQAGTEHIYDTVAQADTSGTGEAATESSKATYAKVMKKKKANRNNGADAEQGAGDGDVTYAEIELKPTKKSKKVKEKASLGDDTVYSELQQNMK
ncbi:B-cell receptor CD22-like [Neoarius graeffei]|uniref:B-cell receptor CD22-like n=1 Tax=Neoarius graeffei TaxID=443677 RepID=UPI00298CB3C2|nr:B-cell receptor CD22-like [Neoarius graeffei]